MSKKINIVGNYRKSGLGKKQLEDIVRAVFLSQKSKVKSQKEINIAFVSPEEIQRLNKEYRRVGKPTDVLSFDYGDEGDTLLCIDLIQEMKDGSESLPEAVQKTLIHGILHLFNYNHESKKERAIMEKLEEKIFLQLSFPRRRESK